MSTKRLSLIPLLATMLALLPAAAATAAPAVTNTDDSGPGSLRAAVEGAAPGETVNVPPGTYTLTGGPLLVTKSLAIVGNGAGDTIVRSAGNSGVLETIGPVPAIDVTIAGITVRDGVVNGSPAIGAGIFSVQTNLTLRGVVVTANRANADGGPGASGGLAIGGGVFLVEGAFQMFDSVVSSNTASAVGGSGKNGGTAEGGGLFLISRFTIENSTISGNRVDSRGGQGPSNASQDGGLALGGGLLAIEDATGPASVVATTIDGNVIDARGGAGGNGGVGQGGGAHVIANGFPTLLSRITVAENSARIGPVGSFGGGGGLFLVSEDPGSLTVTGSTISGNNVDTAAPGGGNLLAVAAKLANTIVNAGSGPAGSENCVVEQTESLGFNLDSADQCGFKATGDQVNANPLLGPLQNNGGPTETMALPPESPAVDKGSSFGLGTDQRGVQRPIEFPSIPNSSAPGADGSDIGAFELQPQSTVTLGKLKRNKKRGTAVLTVSVPLPDNGTIVLFGKGLKRQTKAVDGSTGTFRFKVVPKGKVKKALRKRGKRKVGIRVTYAPNGNSAVTASRKAKLVKKKRKKNRRGQSAKGKGKQR